MATILIVDDLAANRSYLVTLLRYHGHRMIEAADGHQALVAIRADRPDLVISDVLMPVMDGYELVKNLRLDPATRDIPVVFSTAHYGEREARALALSGGVSDVLTKPTESADVLMVVNRVLSGTAAAPVAAALTPAFDREHLRLITDKLSEKADDLSGSNARLRALINIGLELASQRDSDRLLHSVCVAARDLFGATYLTLGIVDRTDRIVQRVVTHGIDAAEWLKTGESVAGLLATVITERKTLRGDHLPDGSAGTAFPPLHPPVQAFLAAPIASPAYVYGWICLVGNEGRTFTEDDEHLVRALSGQVGRIYENGYFYAIAQKRAEELQHEILERRQAEAALRHERDRAQRYLDTAEVILLALDLDGCITLINRKGCDILGRAESELLGHDWVDTCIPAGMRNTVRARFHKVVAGSLPILEQPVVTRSGAERMIEWRNTVLRNDGGRVIGTFSSGADITERSHAVEAMRTAEERMRFALQSANVGIWDMDFTTGVLQWSATLETQYGVAPGTGGSTFASFVDRIHPDDRSMVVDTLESAKALGDDFSIQNRAIWPDGTVRWLSGTGRMHLGEHGEPVRGVGISLDITERRLLEDQYQQAQKMEAVGRLAGGVAHDFNNLLTVILGYCDLVLDVLDPDDPSQSDLGEIKRAGERAAGLTRQLLAFSRKQIIEPTLLDLNVVVGNMQAMLGRLIEENVTVALNLCPNLSNVKADRGQVEQIVMNLAVNARDAMPHGGTLTIETANVNLDEHYARTHVTVVPGRYVALTLTDTGTGMTPLVQARLFEPFFTTKAPGMGTGLGLATVHGIVTRCGGSVHAYSEVGLGTSFKVYFPCAEVTEAIAEATPPHGTVPAVGQTVLVVEDADGLRELARRLLQRLNYTVLVAANAEEALQQFDNNPSIDVLLTDVVMPGTSGPELARRLVEEHAALRVIYMSGYTEEAIVHHGVLNPGIAFLHKPFTSETLGRKINEVLCR